jgi:hemerythrin-like metal-binding protein
MSSEAFVHYKTSIACLDNQHWKLFEIINEISACSDASRSIELFDVLLERLITHNLLEAELMDTYNYPYGTPHQQAHLSILLEVVLVKKRLLANEIWILQTFLEQLSDKLSNHIDHYDLQFAQWVIDHCGNDTYLMS